MGKKEIIFIDTDTIAEEELLQEDSYEADDTGTDRS